MILTLTSRHAHIKLPREIRTSLTLCHQFQKVPLTIGTRRLIPTPLLNTRKVEVMSTGRHTIRRVFQTDAALIFGWVKNDDLNCEFLQELWGDWLGCVDELLGAQVQHVGVAPVGAIHTEEGQGGEEQAGADYRDEDYGNGAKAGDGLAFLVGDVPGVPAFAGEAVCAG